MDLGIFQLDQVGADIDGAFALDHLQSHILSDDGDLVAVGAPFWSMKRRVECVCSPWKTECHGLIRRSLQGFKLVLVRMEALHVDSREQPRLAVAAFKDDASGRKPG